MTKLTRTIHDRSSRRSFLKGSTALSIAALASQLLPDISAAEQVTCSPVIAPDELIELRTPADVRNARGSLKKTVVKGSIYRVSPLTIGRRFLLMAPTFSAAFSKIVQLNAS